MSGMIVFLFSLLAASGVCLVGCGLWLLIHLRIKMTRGGGEDA